MREESTFLIIGRFFLVLTMSLFGCRHEQSKNDLKSQPLTYTVEGKGSPRILMLHGMLGSHRYWDGVVPSLSHRHQVTSLDLLGFGDSPKPDINYTVDEHLKGIEKVILAVETDDLPHKEVRWVLVGHSMGSFLALNFAIAHPEKIEKLVLINPPMKTDEESLKKAMAESSSRLMVTMTFDKTWGHLVCRLHELIPFVSYPLIRVFEPELPPAVAKAAGQHTYASYSGSFENILLKQNFYELLAQVQEIPVLIIASKRDEYTGDRALELLPQRTTLKLVKIDGNHNVVLKDPDRISEEILKFIE